LNKAPADRYEGAGAFAAALTAEEPADEGKSTSIAVLPFANMSADPEDEFFADGITEEIINVLAQLEGLRVTARTSCFAFKGKAEDLRTVGGKLGVGTVLEGSVRKAGSRLRVTTQLVNVADGYHLWSERYDRELTDVFAIQDEIANAIAAKLRVSLTKADADQPVRPGPANLEAYELFLKGRALQVRRGSSLLESLECFERAIELDPDLAEAHAWLADCYRLLAIYGMKPATEFMPRAREAAERALQRDPDQVEALATLANVTASYDWDFPASVAITDRALAKDPSHARALCERAITGAVNSGQRRARARWVADARRGTEIDPLSAWAAGMHAFCLAFAGRSDEAGVQARHAKELDSENFMARWSLVEALTLAGEYDEALAEAEPALRMSGRHPYALTAVVGAHWARGDADATSAMYQELVGRSRTGYIGASWLAAAAAAAGQLDEARTFAKKAVQERETFLLYWNALPDWAAFRSDPTCAEILKETGL
jgi:serine/threonine-protein kinase